MTKTKLARILIASTVVLVVLSGELGQLRYEGICFIGIGQTMLRYSVESVLHSFDARQIAITCPLGFLERSLAVGEYVPAWGLPVALVILSVILLGRVFCGWVCPAGVLRRLFRGKRDLKLNLDAARKASIWTSYSPYAVLAGVLVASFAFRFPVFCVLCPVGLAFGTFYAVMKLASPDPLSVELILFPVMLGVEFFALKSWCRSFCPLGALLSLVSTVNPFFRPKINQDACLASDGVNCHACRNACPEGINLRNGNRVLLPNSCTKCFECSDHCPVKAIKFPLWA